MTEQIETSVPDSGPVTEPSQGEAAALERAVQIIGNDKTNGDDNSDAGSYVAIRRLQEAEEAGHELSHGDEKRKIELIRKAARTAVEQPQGDSAHEQPAYSEEQYTEANDHLNRIRNEALQEGKQQVLRDQYFREHPEAQADMQYLRADLELAQTFPEAAPFAPHVAEAIAESDKAMPILHELALRPDLRERLNQMPPKEVSKLIAKAEYILDSDNAAVKYGEQYGVRQTTRAPAPLKPLKGGSSPGKSLGDMSMSEYIKVRNAQNKD